MREPGEAARSVLIYHHFQMTGSEWVLLPGPLGMLGLLGFASAMNSASLSGVVPANEIEDFRVCAYLCDENIAGKPCEVFCTSRRQSLNQSNTVVSKKDVGIGAKVRGTPRFRACPTLCRHGLGLPDCGCKDYGISSRVSFSWREICESLCEDDDFQPPGCIQCSKNQRNNYRAVEESNSPDDFFLHETPRGRVPDGESYNTNNENLNQAVIQERNSDEFDWEKFCEAECRRGNGGLACRCDIIPYWWVFSHLYLRGGSPDKLYVYLLNIIYTYIIIYCNINMNLHIL